MCDVYDVDLELLWSCPGMFSNPLQCFFGDCVKLTDHEYMRGVIDVGSIAPF